MIIDAMLQFSDNQDVKAGGASTKVVDLKQDNPDIGLWKEPLYIVVAVTKPFAGGTSPTFKIELQDSNSSGSGFTTVLSTAAMTAPTSTESPIILPMPTKHRRYLKLNFTVTGTPTAGNVSAYLTNALQANTDWLPEK